MTRFHGLRRAGAGARLSFLAATLVLAFSARGFGQSTYGAVVGVVTDSTRAVAPGATVTLREVQTNVTRTTTSGADGNYEFLNLTQGRYQVSVEMSGFSRLNTEPFPVSARQTVRIDLELKTAALSEEVTVSGAAPLLNTENPTISGSKTNRELQNLPFTFRTFNTSPVDTIAVLPEVQKGTDVNNPAFSLSGGQSYQNEVSVDGISTTNVRRNGVGEGARNIFPSVEGIEEIRVSSINNNAEFATTGDITTITKPGTNRFHGSGFVNFNNEGLNANPNYFNRAIPNKSDNRNYGASLSGPIFRNKTFFFLTYERLSIARTGVGTATVPEADFRAGNFSRLATPITDPRTGLPFPGNVIPQSRLNPVSTLLLSKYIPSPNEGLAIARHSLDATEITNQVDLRLDHNFTPGHTAFVRFSGKNLDRVSPTNFQSTGPARYENPTRNLVFSDNWAMKPSVLNELRFGFTTSDLGTVTGLIGRDFVQEAGLRLISQNLPQGSGSSRFDVAGYSAFGENKQEPLATRVIQFGDNVTWIAGRHTFKAGADVRNYHWTSPLNFTGVDDFGVFRFRAATAGGTGNALANFLLGIPNDVDQTATGPGVDGKATHYGFFVQDEWRVNNKVTVNLGLRYDLYPGFEDAELNITNFLRDTPNGDAVVPNEASRQIAQPAFTSGLGTSRILTAAEAGLPETLRFTDKNNFAPRLGVAWRPFDNNRTVVRAGYGIFYTRFLGAIFNSLTGIHTSDNQTFGNSFDAATRTHAIVLPNTFAGAAGRGTSAVGNQNFSTANDPNMKDPQTQQWSLSLDREVGRRSAFRFTYSGRRDRNLTLAPDLNQLQPNTVGYVNLPRTARPFPNWARINTRDGGGEADYHDLTFQLRGIAVEGLTYSATYKWSHATSNIEQATNKPNFVEEINDRTDNRFDPDYTRGPVTAIPDHRVTATLLWDLPFFKGNKVLGGWTVSSIMTAQSGFHLTATYGSHCGSGTNCYTREKADAVSGQDPNDGPKTVQQWFNTAAFTDRGFFDAAGRPIFAARWGNAEKGSILGPGLYTIDLGLFKEFKLSGDVGLKVQVQAQNVTNHPNYGLPETNITSPNYGRITTLQPGTLGSRIVVVGARVTF